MLYIVLKDICYIDIEKTIHMRLMRKLDNDIG